VILAKLQAQQALMNTIRRRAFFAGEDFNRLIALAGVPAERRKGDVIRTDVVGV